MVVNMQELSAVEVADVAGGAGEAGFEGTATLEHRN